MPRFQAQFSGCVLLRPGTSRTLLFVKRDNGRIERTSAGQDFCRSVSKYKVAIQKQIKACVIIKNRPVNSRRMTMDEVLHAGGRKT
jgi:hypothetical protein